MLRFDRLIIENFGPFNGEQVIEFSQEDGVTIIWGDNGRGKTTLLNIFRFALFGQVSVEKHVNSVYLELCNWEKQEEGIFEFSVTLEMKNDDIPYRLIRRVMPKGDIVDPKKDEDFEMEVQLLKGRAFLSPDSRAHELSKIMPHEVSRFFLFDGELLQEYSTLVDDSSDEGHTIKKGIEQILGLPILTNARSDIDNLLKDYKREKNNAAQLNEKTSSYAVNISNLDKIIAAHQTEISKLKNLITERKKEYSAIEEEMNRTKSIRQYLETEKSLNDQLNILKDQKDEILNEVKSYMKDAWFGMIAPKITEYKDILKLELNELEKKTVSSNDARLILREIEHSINQGSCNLCGQGISDSLVIKLKNKIQDIKQKHPILTDDEKSRYLKLKNKITVLSSRSLVGKQNDLLKQKLVELSKTIFKISDLQQKIDENKDDIKNYGDYDQNLVGIVEKYANCKKQIEELERGKKKEEDALTTHQSTRDRLDAIINQTDDSAINKAENNLKLCQSIYDIFNEGIEKYKDLLKCRVQQDATELFVKMSSDPDYESLEINKNYGLEIKHISGRTISQRSEGFEHVVALSLIGALHKNAPLQGPVIMDSPFGRLDPTHKHKVTESLPSLSDQVILLAYTDEINQNEARDILGNKLTDEFRLERISSYHTEIKRA